MQTVLLSPLPYIRTYVYMDYSMGGDYRETGTPPPPQKIIWVRKRKRPQ